MGSLNQASLTGPGSQKNPVICSEDPIFDPPARSHRAASSTASNLSAAQPTYVPPIPPPSRTFYPSAYPSPPPTTVVNPNSLQAALAAHREVDSMVHTLQAEKDAAHKHKLHTALGVGAAGLGVATLLAWRNPAARVAIRDSRYMKGLYTGIKSAFASLLEKEATTGVKGLGKVVGLEDLKRAVRQDFSHVVKNPELSKMFRVKMPNGMLLHGPPGTGKTFFAEQLAEELGFHIETIDFASLGSPYFSETEKNIAAAFDAAIARKPAIVFIDEIDSIGRSRGEGSSVDGGSSHRIVNTLLQKMNNLNKHDVFVVATTNHPGRLDPALLRRGRFDMHFYVGLPAEKDRADLISRLIEGRPHSVAPAEINRIAKQTEAYSPADLTFLLDEAARKASYRSTKEKVSKITMDDLEVVLAKTKPTTNLDQEKQLEREFHEFLKRLRGGE